MPILSVSLVLRHIQPWGNPVRDTELFSSIGKPVRGVESFSNVEESWSKGERNRELESGHLSQMEKGENSV